MRRIFCISALIILQAFFFSAYAEDLDRNIKLFWAQKTINGNFDPVSTLDGPGLEIDFPLNFLPVNFELGFYQTTASESSGGIDYEVTTNEFNVGLRHYFEPSIDLHPYASLGYSRIDLDVALTGGATSADATDTGNGYFVGGGLLWRFQERLHLALNLKYSSANASDQDVDIGGTQLGLGLGYSF